MATKSKKATAKSTPKAKADAKLLAFAKDILVAADVTVKADADFEAAKKAQEQADINLGIRIERFAKRSKEKGSKAKFAQFRRLSKVVTGSARYQRIRTKWISLVGALTKKTAQRHSAGPRFILVKVTDRPTLHGFLADLTKVGKKAWQKRHDA